MGKKLTTKEIKERIYSIEGNEYELLSEYVNSKTKFKIRHNVCGYEYEVIWSNFQKGSRCPKCAGQYRYTDSEIDKLVAEMTKGEYTKLSAYINANTKFKIKHNLCGYGYEVIWNAFQQGRRCPKCAGFIKLTNKEIIQKIYELVGDEYTKIDNVYINANTKFKIKHNTCGNEYEVKWGNFQAGKRCPKCNQSKGEKFISDYLTNQHISFTTQVRFDDCRHKLPLPFDFGIIDRNKKIIALIEYDGQQHFEPVDLWGGEEALKEVQLRDKIKDDYCKEQNIPLLRIKYDEENTLKIIEEFISPRAQGKFN